MRNCIPKNVQQIFRGLKISFYLKLFSGEFYYQGKLPFWKSEEMVEFQNTHCDLKFFFVQYICQTV